LLFQIDPRTFEAAVDQAQGMRAQQRALYQTAKANLARVKPLAAKNALSQKDLDDTTGAELSAKASLEAAEASLQTAKLNLSFTRITSPIDGIAGIAKAQIGDLLSPSMATELTTVSTVDPIKVYFNISEREYLPLARAVIANDGKRQVVPLELILVDGSAYPHNGEFSLLDRQVDPTTGTFKGAAVFPNPDRLLRPGQYGRIRATMSVQKGALLVPQRAVTEIQGKYLLAVVGADNKVAIRPVTVGERIGSDWIIASGLQPGEKVIAEGTQKVKDGSMVNPKPFEPAPPAAGKAATSGDKPAAPAPESKG
jgi:membrane fusion protein (multidrug efflux system)